jgi:hypothetical protein
MSQPETIETVSAASSSNARAPRATMTTRVSGLVGYNGNNTCSRGGGGGGGGGGGVSVVGVGVGDELEGACARRTVETKAGPNAPLCRFFNTTKGCQFGAHCRYRHVVGIASDAGTNTSTSTSTSPGMMSGGDYFIFISFF